VGTSQEPTLTALRHGASRHDRGDELFMTPNTIVVGDVSVTHPAVDTYVVAAARAPGAPAARWDREKRRKYDTYGNAQDYDFAALIVETYGRLGRPAMAMLNALADAAAANGGVSKATFVRGALRELAVALGRGNALMCRVSMFQLARTAGRGHRPGLLVPTVDSDHD
jgi:hypothetical protein